MILNFISILLILFGIYVGYITSFYIYDFIILSLPINMKKEKERFDAFSCINELITERYQLGAIQLSENYFSDDLSVKEKNAITNFYLRLDEIGIKYIYIKQKHSNKLLFTSHGFGEKAVFQAQIYINE